MNNKHAVEMAKLSKNVRHRGKTKAQISQMYRDIAAKRDYKKVIPTIDQ